MTAHGQFNWNELMTRDVEASKKFYADLLGWSYEAMPMGGDETYWIAKAGAETVAGIFDISADEFKEVPESWLAYIAVDNVDARVQKATAAGSEIMKPAFDIPGVGRIVILFDPGGAAIGLMTPAS